MKEMKMKQEAKGKESGLGSGLITLSVIAFFFLFLMTPSFSVNEPSQQSNKIYYAPYYVASMTANTNTTFNLPINPPDGISEVKSAVINFQVYAAPTITFTLYANNKSCNPSAFSIATTYASTGLLSFAFDCSNVIKSAGNYTLKMAPSKTTGATYGWMDFVYVNNPNGQMEVKGTEYFAGDRGTVFLQLVDAYGQPITTAACFTDIYYPSSYDTNHTPFVEDVPMLYKEEGLYYYDFIVPPYTGVYMVLANCRYGHTARYYQPDETTFFPNVTVTIGLLTGSSAILNSYSDQQYIKLDVVTQKTDINATFTNITETNISTISFGTFFQTQSVGSITGMIWNYTGNKWQSISTIATAGTGGSAPSLYDEYYAFSTAYSADFLVNKTVKIRLNSSAGTGALYYNAMWLNFYTFDPQYVPIYGSGELHISSEGASPFIVSTLCGNSLSSCSIFYSNYTNYPYPEGSIYDNVTVTAQETKSDTWSYTTPPEVDCTAFNRILYRNATNASWTELDFSAFTMETAATKNCIMHIPLNATRGASYYYRLEYGNYMKYNLRDNWNLVQKLNSTAELVCNPVLSGTNYSYSVPIYYNTTVASGSSEPNNTLRICHQVYDGVYWAKNYEGLSHTTNISGTYYQYVEELNYYQELLFRSVTSLLSIDTVNLIRNLNNTLNENISAELLNMNASLHSSLARNFTDTNGMILYANNSVHSALASNFTQVRADVASVNSTMLSSFVSLNTTVMSQFSALNIYLGQQFGYVLGNLSAGFNTLNANLFGNFSYTNGLIGALNAAMSGNFTYTNALIISTNFTPNFTVDFTPVLSAMGSNFTYTNGQIAAVNSNVLSTNVTLHDALSGISSDIFNSNQNILNTNSTLHASNSRNTTAILNAINGTDYLVWYANESVHLAMSANFNYTNALINATNITLYEKMDTLYLNGTNITNAINATLPTGFFTKMNVMSSLFMVLVAGGILFALWRFFK
jgi:hypothetical protein